MSGPPGDFSHSIEGHYVRPWSLNLLFWRRGFGLVVSVVVPLMLAVLPYARGRGFDTRSIHKCIAVLWRNTSTVFGTCSPRSAIFKAGSYYVSTMRLKRVLKIKCFWEKWCSIHILTSKTLLCPRFYNTLYLKCFEGI
jgi:hypothetical protein